MVQNLQLKTIFYSVGKLFVRLLFGCVTDVHLLRRDNAKQTGGFLLAANHISHFDPFLISLVVRRKIDWMTMAEFFRVPGVGLLLRAIDAFPTERNHPDRKSVRTAIDRLKSGRVIGLFPEGGIRDGVRSLLQDAAIRPGAAMLAQIAHVPIVPCVILGSDRLYSAKRWLPWRRTPVWIAFGSAILDTQQLSRTDARRRIESELTAAFKRLYAQLRDEFHLATDDLPHPPRERCGARVVASSENAVLPAGSKIHRYKPNLVDSLLCGSLNLLHARHRLNGRGREEMERYVSECERLTPKEYYATPERLDAAQLSASLARAARNGRTTIRWRSPINTRFPANDIAHAELFQCTNRMNAPTVFLLHSLMSTSRIGHHRWAIRLNELGWNACFVHLPYHFSRIPRGYWNGELAITCDLIRNAEGLRQGVIELRELMNALRQNGYGEFGVLATSYGGWVGALIATVETDLRFVALMAPIVDVEHAIWKSPASRRIRRELCRANIERSLVARHFHLSSPLHCQPACDPARILFVTGEFDSIAPAPQIEAIHHKWRGSELLRVRQGHFGHRMMHETITRLRARGDL